MTSRSPRQQNHRPRRGGVIFWVILVLLVSAGAVLLLQRQFTFDPGDQPQSDVAATLEGGAGDRVVSLVFPRLDGSGYLTEERQLPSNDRLEDDLLVVMNALCAGPTSDQAVSSLPRGTVPLAVFYNESEGSIVLDFSQDLVVNHLGGSAAELATLTIILKTIALNFPEVQECLLLVEGAQSETLAGHLSLDQPFDPRRWF
ncbi:MAG: GerMN domain-containing protein [bacterium]